MFYRGYVDGPDGREMGPKRQRMMDQAPPGPFYGPHPGSGFMLNPYGFVAPPPPPPPLFPVVRLRGLPYDCAELDVADFFHGLDVVDVLFVHKNNKLTGEAFCVLGYPLQVDFALQKNRQNMGRRYVEVFRSTKQEYYKAISNEVAESRVHGTASGFGGGGNGAGKGGGGGGSGVSDGCSPRKNVQRARSSDDGKENAEHTGIIRLRGLPFSAGKEDILDFFKDFDLSEDSVHVTVNGEGRPTGEAFVEFGNAEESRAAMVKDRKTLGSRYIELFPSSMEELEEALSRGR